MKKLLSMLFALSVSATALAAPQDFNISWSPVTGSQKYQLKTRIDSGTPVTNDVATGTAFTVNKDITTGQTLFASVRSCDAIWCGDWSPEANFVMPAKPGTPSIIGIQLIFTN